MSGELAAVLLAAGEGRRLRPLTGIRPKPLCPVGESTPLDQALARVARYARGPEQVAVNAHHLADQVVTHVGDRARLSVERRQRLGTAGALGALRAWVAGRPVLVHNADAYLAGDPADALTPLFDGWDGRRVRLLTVPAVGEGDFDGRRYVGVCLLPAPVAASLPAEPGGLYRLVFVPARAAGRLELVTFPGTAIDCGTPRDYLRANLHASGGRSVVGAGARVDGKLVRSVVWPGGVVTRGERLVECVRVGRELTVPAPQASSAAHEHPAGDPHAEHEHRHA